MFGVCIAAYCRRKQIHDTKTYTLKTKNSNDVVQCSFIRIFASKLKSTISLLERNLFESLLYNFAGNIACFQCTCLLFCNYWQHKIAFKYSDSSKNVASILYKFNIVVEHTHRRETERKKQRPKKKLNKHTQRCKGFTHSRSTQFVHFCSALSVCSVVCMFTQIGG